MLQQDLQKQETAKPTIEKVTKRFVTPSVNIYETEDDTRIILDMPGVDEKSVEISYEKDILTIEGRNSYNVPEGFEPMYLEFKTGDYLRKFNVNKPIDLEKSKAVMKNGKLTLSLAKVKPNTKRIEVKSE
ncbi:MAG: Hsp20/alpha crystallin family protein [Leptospiraceae bacterium]|nr:Hsp20/alpha crystallin family protein [Leptospiraceae bacterium]